MKAYIGDIIENRWAGTNNPTRFFIYLGINGDYVQGLEFINGRLNRVSYYKKDMDKLMDNGTKAFEVVGHTDGFHIMQKDLLKQQEQLKGAGMNGQME